MVRDYGSYVFLLYGILQSVSNARNFLESILLLVMLFYCCYSHQPPHFYYPDHYHCHQSSSSRAPSYISAN